MPDLTNSKRYIDLSKWFEDKSGYMDWEGMASTDGLLDRVNAKIKEFSIETGDPEQVDIIRTLVLHYLYMCRDQADYELNDDELGRVVEFAEMMTGTRWIMRETAV